MKKRTIGFLTLSAFGLASMAQVNEPVIMTINGNLFIKVNLKMFTKKIAEKKYQKNKNQ